MIALPSPILRGLSFPPAILILRVAALYDNARWVGRGLWIFSGVVYTVTIILASFAIKSFYSEFILASIGHQRKVAPNESTDNFVYDPWAGVCLPSDLTFRTYAAVIVPLAFDIVIIVLTALKTYRFAIALRKQSGSMIVSTSLSDGTAYVDDPVFGSCTLSFEMAFCEFKL